MPLLAIKSLQFQLAQNKGTKAYSQKANQSGDKLGRFIPHKNKDSGQVKVTINEDGEEVCWMRWRVCWC